MPANAVRVPGLELQLQRSAQRVIRMAALANAHESSGARERYRISEEALHEIRAKMPTLNAERHDWEVQAVMQYTARR